MDREKYINSILSLLSISSLLFIVLIFIWFGRQIFVSSITVSQLYFAVLITIPINVLTFLILRRLNMFDRLDEVIAQVVLFVMETVISMGAIAVFKNHMPISAVLSEWKNGMILAFLVAFSHFAVMFIILTFGYISSKKKRVVSKKTDF